MSDAKIRRMSLKNLVKSLEDRSIHLDDASEFFVEFSESEMVDLIFGKLTAKDNQDDTIIARGSSVRKVLGGISPICISKKHILGIESNKDGTYTVNMSAPWIKKFEISVDDFTNGVPRFFRSAAAMEISGAKSYGFVTNPFFENYRMRVGRIWLLEISKVYEYKQQRSGTKSIFSVVDS